MPATVKAKTAAGAGDSKSADSKAAAGTANANASAIAMVGAGPFGSLRSSYAFAAMSVLDAPLRQCGLTVLRCDTEWDVLHALSGGVVWFQPNRAIAGVLHETIAAVVAAPPLQTFGLEPTPLSTSPPPAPSSPVASAGDSKTIVPPALQWPSLWTYVPMPLGGCVYHSGHCIASRLAPTDLYAVTLFCRVHRLLDRSADSKLHVSIHRVFVRPPNRSAAASAAADTKADGTAGAAASVKGSAVASAAVADLAEGERRLVIVCAGESVACLLLAMPQYRELLPAQIDPFRVDSLRNRMFALRASGLFATVARYGGRRLRTCPVCIPRVTVRL
jgi:hypothetical protein